tara:strand:+ start:20084 stop:20335 length:252 start_codon:yes stop_codon:yes gene_type:complete
MLVIKEEKYPIQVGSERYSVEYPSFEEAQAIGKEFNGLGGEEAVTKMKEWLIKLGLEEKFFGLKIIKAKHIITIWQEINSVKK